MNSPLLSVENLYKWYTLGNTWPWQPNKVLKAVDGVTFTLHAGETLGLVGESGCGKSTIGKTVVALHRPTQGHILFEGHNIHTPLRQDRSSLQQKIQMIFQDPYASLNPRMTIFEILEEPLLIHLPQLTPAYRRERILSTLDKVGLLPEQANRFPNEFSGGQRQRIGIARSIIQTPSLIVCDEPVSALDVSMQAQIINLLQDLQQEQHFSYLFIAHDLTVVRHISHRIAVMYLGSLFEIGPSAVLYDTPLHPYTKALLAAVPKIGQAPIPVPLLSDELPDPTAPPLGCKFHPRCPHMLPHCRHITPQLQPIDGRSVACHLYHRLP